MKMPFVLLVDDDPDVLKTLSQSLQDKGFHVEEATNGEEALEVYRSSPADLVITDIFMPKKGGLELITELQSEFPQAKIFAMSAGLAQRKADPLKMAEVLGAARTFEKPVCVSTLVEAIREEMK